MTGRWLIDREEFLPADIIFTSSSGTLGKMIGAAEQGPGEGESYARHVGIFVGADQVVEAREHVVQRSYREITDPYQVWRCSSLDDVGRAKAATRARGFVGASYGWWKLFLHGFDSIVTKLRGKETVLARRLIFDENHPICNMVAALAVAAAGYFFGRKPEWTDPDQMHDWCVAHLDHWTMIYEVRNEDA